MTLVAPATAAKGVGDASARGRQRSPISTRPCLAAFLPLLPGSLSTLSSFRRRASLFCFRGAARNSRNQAVVILEAAADNHSLGCDLVFPDIFTVIAPAHLDNYHDFAELALDLHIAKPDDIVGEKR